MCVTLYTCLGSSYLMEKSNPHLFLNKCGLLYKCYIIPCYTNFLNHMMFSLWKMNPSLQEQLIRNDLYNGDHNLDAQLMTNSQGSWTESIISPLPS